MSAKLPSRAARHFRLALCRTRTAIDETDEEILFHLEARAEQLVRQGFSPEQARAEATRRFGSLADARERLQRSTAHREHLLRLRELTGIVLQDAHIAWRGLRRSPGFVAVEGERDRTRRSGALHFRQRHRESIRRARRAPCARAHLSPRGQRGGAEATSSS